jgi:hypothetical protein
MIDILQGWGAEWTPVDDLTDDQRADFLTSLSREELAEAGVYGSSMRRVALQAANEDRVRKYCLASLRDSLTHAELDGDEVMASRLRMTIAAAEMMETADDIVDLIAGLQASE